ncbi:hypothetical protein WJ74_08550 [Burkholderia ubonensis]|uniref:hypothetical protein n=1 Tax=Burkholderia ubonensis TaxID=101571 RepID=UPI0007541655|nr:hypothetical protein [Burkholderia ubonensis]KVO17497.1 hypothetical protein WJ74_08550 [Burkholderia ubonensis]
MSTISLGPVDTRPMNSNRTMQVLGTRAWLGIRPREAAVMHPVMQALRQGETVTPVELATLIPGLATADWQRANGFGSDIAHELATHVDGLQVNLILSAPEVHKLAWEEAEPELRDVATRLSAALLKPRA